MCSLLSLSDARQRGAVPSLYFRGITIDNVVNDYAPLCLLRGSVGDCYLLYARDRVALCKICRIFRINIYAKNPKKGLT